MDNFHRHLGMIFDWRVRVLKMHSLSNRQRMLLLYPFHIAECAVTPHWTPLSMHPLCCCYTPVCFHTECRISAFWRVRFKKRSKIEQKDIITPMHCLAFPSALFGAPFHIDNRTVANCGFWLEYASKTPLEVGADLPRRMRLFWLRCQIMRLRSVHIKPHYSQNAFDSALLAWYERGINLLGWQELLKKKKSLRFQVSHLADWILVKLSLKPKYNFGKWWKWKISLMGIVHNSCMSSQSPVNLFVRNHQFS